MYSKDCPIEGCDVVLHDDDMDRLIDHMKAHIKKHEEGCGSMKPELADIIDGGGVKKMIPQFPDIKEDENKMKSTAPTPPEDGPGEVEEGLRRMEEDEANEYRDTIDIEDEITLTVTHNGHPATPNIAIALCDMQKADLGASADSKNPMFGNYADLSSVWGVIRKPLTDAGLSIMQYPERFHGGITVVTRLYHVSGEMFETRLSGTTVLPPVKEKGVVVGEGKATVQGLGSLITYLRRYSISMLVGVAPKDDDDGNEASNKDVRK